MERKIADYDWWTDLMQLTDRIMQLKTSTTSPSLDCLIWRD